MRIERLGRAVAAMRNDCVWHGAAVGVIAIGLAAAWFFAQAQGQPPAGAQPPTEPPFPTPPPTQPFPTLPPDVPTPGPKTPTPTRTLPATVTATASATAPTRTVGTPMPSTASPTADEATPTPGDGTASPGTVAWLPYLARNRGMEPQFPTVEPALADTWP